MKKLLLSLGLGILSFTGFTQVQFNLTGTCQYQGNYGLTWTDDSFWDGSGGTTQTWNTPNMLDPANAVSANLVLVQGADPTPHGNCTFDMACNGSAAITNSAALAGNIAVIRRGGCEFGSKAYAAQQAGAIACIIVNAVGDPIGMAGGADGMNVFIPTIMVSATTGAIICDAIAAGCPEAFIGNIAGFYNDNLSLAAGDVYRPGRAMDISWDYTGAADHGFGPGAIVNNLGNNDQLGITVTLDVYEVGNPTAVYSVISAPFNLVGVTITGGIPTVDNTLVDFSAVTPASFVNSTATNQNYELVYTVNAPNADATPIDNEVRSFFGISDTEYSHAQIDPANGKALASAGRGPRTDPGNQPTTDHWMMCNHFSPQTNNVKAVGTKFQAYTYDPIVSTDLIGKTVSCVVYEWINTKGIYDMTDPGFTTDVDTNSWTELTRVDYFYGGDYQDSIISVDYNNQIGLDSAKHYFFCTRVDAVGDITTYTGFNIRADTKTDYTMTNGAYTGVPSPTGGQPTTVVIEDGKFFSAGYGFEEATNSIILMGFNDVGVKEVENNRELAAYPNPAVNTITVPFGNVTGNATITVVDIAGKVVSTQTVNLTGGNVTLDVSDLESGMYSFNVVYANGTKGQFKVVVTK